MSGAADSIRVRLSPTICADYRERGVFPEIDAAAPGWFQVDPATARRMHDDAQARSLVHAEVAKAAKAAETGDSEAAVAMRAFRALAAQLAELLNRP